MPKLRPNQFTLPSGKVITEIPMLFQSEMVQALLQDRKTETRRTRGLEKRNESPDEWTREGASDKTLYQSFKDSDLKINGSPLFEFIKTSRQTDREEFYTRPRYGKPGDLLWVRESFQKTSRFYYKADFSEQIARKASASGATWKPSIHMPKAASRIWLMVESIGVEQVWNINHSDARHEGVQSFYTGTQMMGWKNYLNEDPRYLNTSFLSFASLWISINGLDSWNANPWVWVIKFRVLSKTGRPSEELIAEHHQQIASPRSSSRNDARKEVSDV